MQIEHIAFNVNDPGAVAQWYAQNLNLKIIRKHGPPTHAHFLAAAPGQAMLEIYTNPAGKVLDFREISALSTHLAFSVKNLSEARERLIRAGGTADGEVSRNPEGDELAIVRDPWGFPIQLVRRVKPMV